MYLLYKGKYLLPFYFCSVCPHCQRANLKLGKLKTIFEYFKVNLRDTGNLFQTVSWRIQGGGKLLARRKEVGPK